MSTDRRLRRLRRICISSLTAEAWCLPRSVRRRRSIRKYSTATWAAINWRRSVDIREDDYRELVVGIVGQHRIEAFDSASVRNFFVAINGAYAQAKSVVVFEWRGHLLQRSGRKQLSSE